LVVDNDVPLRKVIARILAMEGYNVLTAGSGVEALTIARTLEGRLPLVVTDLEMPEMNGLALARHLARLTPTPQVLFMSGDATPPHGELPGQFLAKPFALRDLTGCVRRMLDVSGSLPTTGPSAM
jgi:two-component system, cell cycle sensor histidine kinase and response regulator CckA